MDFPVCIFENLMLKLLFIFFKVWCRGLARTNRVLYRWHMYPPASH